MNEQTNEWIDGWTTLSKLLQFLVNMITTNILPFFSEWQC